MKRHQVLSRQKWNSGWALPACRPALLYGGNQYELPQAQNLQDSHRGRGSISLDLMLEVSLGPRACGVASI